MIYSLGNLRVVVNTTKQPPVLNNVFFDGGATVAFNGATLAIVGPVTDDMREQVFVEETPGAPVVVSAETVKEIIKNLPPDKATHGLLEHCDLDKDGIFRLTDGRRKRQINGKVFDREFIPYQEVLRRAKASPVVQRIELNRHRLRTLLEFMDKACPDNSGEAPVYLEFTENADVIMRALNPMNGQRAIGYMTAYKEGEWLEPDAWEEALTAPSQTKATPVRKAAVKRSK